MTSEVDVEASRANLARQATRVSQSLKAFWSEIAREPYRFAVSYTLRARAAAPPAFTRFARDAGASWRCSAGEGSSA